MLFQCWKTVETAFVFAGAPIPITRVICVFRPPGRVDPHSPERFSHYANRKEIEAQLRHHDYYVQRHHQLAQQHAVPRQHTQSLHPQHHHGYDPRVPRHDPHAMYSVAHDPRVRDPRDHRDPRASQGVVTHQHAYPPTHHDPRIDPRQWTHSHSDSLLPPPGRLSPRQQPPPPRTHTSLNHVGYGQPSHGNSAPTAYVPLPQDMFYHPRHNSTDQDRRPHDPYPSDPSYSSLPRQRDRRDPNGLLSHAAQV